MVRSDTSGKVFFAHKDQVQELIETQETESEEEDVTADVEMIDENDPDDLYLVMF